MNISTLRKRWRQKKAHPRLRLVLLMDALWKMTKLCAVAAMTSPKNGGQLFLKGAKFFVGTVIAKDRA